MIGLALLTSISIPADFNDYPRVETDSTPADFNDYPRVETNDSVQKEDDKCSRPSWDKRHPILAACGEVAILIAEGLLMIILISALVAAVAAAVTALVCLAIGAAPLVPVLCVAAIAAISTILGVVTAFVDG